MDAEHQEIREKKRRGENVTVEDVKKMKYSWQVARESMRLHPPIFGSFRKTIADIHYEGFTIPKGWKVNYYIFHLPYLLPYLAQSFTLAIVMSDQKYNSFQQSW